MIAAVVEGVSKMISSELKLTLPFDISEDEARLLFAVELYMARQKQSL